MAKNGKKTKKSTQSQKLSERLPKVSEIPDKTEADKEVAVAGGSESTTHSSTGIKSDHNDAPVIQINSRIANHASLVLAMAGLSSLAMVIVALTMLGGREAVSAIGGVLQPEGVPLPTANRALLFDILFPIFYGAGFMLLATSLQTRGNRPLVRIILTAILIGVVADFSENMLVYQGLKDGDWNSMLPPLTLIKYGSLAVSGVSFSALLNGNFSLTAFLKFTLSVIFPIGIACLMTDTGGASVRDAVAISFPVIIFLLAYWARNAAEASVPNTKSI